MAAWSPPRSPRPILPELAPFARAVQARRPDDDIWCKAWTVRDVLIHQTGNAEELARVLEAFLAGAPVEARGFDREAPYHRPGRDGPLLRRAHARGADPARLGPDR
ncbi:maleylpyruvate isomerase N-terminal domain-containing protein [Streptomyces murinus]|uniref:maleylpyruvate isomerase N-terminal domain-containing protein n=1 Tax=Streptomyces murinus TaxID=33900 RepID=UPI00381E1932